MMKEVGEPQVALQLTPDGVSVTIQALLRGDGSDWHHDMVGSWILEVWQKAKTVAEVNTQYGLVGSVVQRPQPSPQVVPLSVVSKEPLEELIQRNVQNGNLLPVTRASGPSLEKWKQQALQILRCGNGTASSKLHSIDPTITKNAVQQRLYGLREKGLVEFRHTGGAPTHGLWYARESETEPAQDIVTRVLPYTRGKTLLMLGGKPNVNSKKGLEHQLSLAELRWPELEESDPIDWWCREIRKPDVDVVIIN